MGDVPAQVATDLPKFGNNIRIRLIENGATLPGSTAGVADAESVFRIRGERRSPASKLHAVVRQILVLGAPQRLVAESIIRSHRPA